MNEEGDNKEAVGGLQQHIPPPTNDIHPILLLLSSPAELSSRRTEAILAIIANLRVVLGLLGSISDLLP